MRLKNVHYWFPVLAVLAFAFLILPARVSASDWSVGFYVGSDWGGSYGYWGEYPQYYSTYPRGYYYSGYPYGGYYYRYPYSTYQYYPQFRFDFDHRDRWDRDRHGDRDRGRDSHRSPHRGR